MNGTLNGTGDHRTIPRVVGESEAAYSQRKAHMEALARHVHDRERVEATLEPDHPDHPLVKFARVWKDAR